jgi:hypothetical protein
MTLQGTLAQMKTAGSRVICICATCGAWDVVDVNEMIRLLGADGSLWDRQPPCEVGDCDQLRHFMASSGASAVMRPLLSPGRNFHELPKEAWCGGWTGLA